jgi:hypothetical protein
LANKQHLFARGIFSLFWTAPSYPPPPPYSTLFCDEDKSVGLPDDEDKGVGSPYDENKSAGLPYNENKGVEVEVGFAVDGVAVIRPNDRNHPHALQCPGGANSKKITRKGRTKFDQ